MRRLPRRVVRALCLESGVFEEVEHDHSAGGQALLVVVLASLAGGAGNLFAARLLGAADIAWSSLLVVAAGFLVTWVAWSFLTMAIGTTLFGGHADMGEMQRVLGHAAAPGLLMIIPGLGLIVSVPWSLVAMVIAVRQACDFTTARAVGTVLTGAVATALLLVPAACFVATR